MTAIECPALDGREVLGFLAAVGCLRLLTDHGDPDATLSWSPATASAAVNTSLAADVAELAGWLVGLVERLEPGQVIPGAPADLPPPGEAPDRIRLAPAALREYVGGLPSGTDRRWPASLVTDLVLDDKGRSQISLFTAPSGKQSMRTMLEKPLELVRKAPVRLAEAVDGWVRVSGCTGEYLDHRVLFDAADAPDGKPAERGVPGATWLALMAYPMFRTTADVRGSVVTSGWRRAGRQPVFQWPLWRQPLTVDGVQALLEHPRLPALGVTVAPAGDPVLRALGVFAVHRAARRRIPGRNFAGVLAPVRPAG